MDGDIHHRGGLTRGCKERLNRWYTLSWLWIKNPNLCKRPIKLVPTGGGDVPNIIRLGLTRSGASLSKMCELVSKANVAALPLKLVGMLGIRCGWSGNRCAGYSTYNGILGFHCDITQWACVGINLNCMDAQPVLEEQMNQIQNCTLLLPNTRPTKLWTSN